jgi:hypothetical protein
MLCGARGSGLRTLHHCWRPCSGFVGRTWAALPRERWVIRLHPLLQGWGRRHYLVFKQLLGRGHLDLCPLRHKVYEDLRLDCLPRSKLDFELSKLD